MYFSYILDQCSAARETGVTAKSAQPRIDYPRVLSGEQMFFEQESSTVRQTRPSASSSPNMVQGNSWRRRLVDAQKLIVQARAARDGLVYADFPEHGTQKTSRARPGRALI
jgi:hypothetical protein